MRKNYYELFGIKENASQGEITEAYHKLIFKYHPDRNPGNKKYEEITKKIISIHDELSDSSKRLEYDKRLSAEREKLSSKFYGNANKLWEDEINNEIHYANHYPNSPRQETKSTQKNSSQNTNSGNRDFGRQSNNPNDPIKQQLNINAVSTQSFAKFFAVIFLIGIIIYSYLIFHKLQ